MNSLSSENIFEIDRKVKELRNMTVCSFWYLISLLKEIKDNNIWESLGCDSFKAYLSQPELSLKPQSINQYIIAYENLLSAGIPIQEFESVEKSKVKLIAPHIKNDPELLDKAKTLSWNDLRDEIPTMIRELPPRPPMYWCETHQQWGINLSDDICTHTS